jgi:cell division protein ZapA (FtsZ GTPase activity inhibitor)
LTKRNKVDSGLKKYRAHIFGDTYAIISDEQETLILEAVKIVDGVMREIADSSQAVDPKKIAVLTALKVAMRSLHIEAIMEQEKRLSSRIMNVLDRQEAIL